MNSPPSPQCQAASSTREPRSRLVTLVSAPHVLVGLDRGKVTHIEIHVAWCNGDTVDPQFPQPQFPGFWISQTEC